MERWAARRCQWSFLAHFYSVYHKFLAQKNGPLVLTGRVWMLTLGSIVLAVRTPSATLVVGVIIVVMPSVDPVHHGVEDKQVSMDVNLGNQCFSTLLV
jgi:hypothetical protein